MPRNIFLLNAENTLVEMREAPYASEDLLQELLARHPALLAGDQMDRQNPRRWLLISREMSLPSEPSGNGRWYVDHLLIDQDAIPTVVEVKRSSDTRIRREVIGQILEYAANAVVYWPVEALRARFEQTCASRHVLPEVELASVLGLSADVEAFWQQVKTNLQAGRVRLVFVADEIPSELRRVVEFLNQQMDPAEVLAVEVKQFMGENLRTLVPSVIGQTEEAKIRKGAAAATEAKQWDEGMFFAELERKFSPPEVEVCRQLLAWAQGHSSSVYWGKGKVWGAFVPVLMRGGKPHQLFAASTAGTIEIYFQTLQNRPAFESEEKRLSLLHRLNQIPGVSIPSASIGQRPSIKFALLTEPASLAKLLEAYGWVVEEILSTQA